MIINLATWIFKQRALAVMLMVMLLAMNGPTALHAQTRASTARDRVGDSRTNLWASNIDWGNVANRLTTLTAAPLAMPFATPFATPLQIVMQAKPGFSPTRPAIVGHGDIITYTLIITNSSGVTQTQLVLTDVVPLGATAISSTASPSATQAPSNGVGPLVWKVSALGAGGSFTVSHAVQVNSLITVTAIVNVAQLRSDQTPPMNSNTTVHVFGGPPNPPAEYWPAYLPVIGTR